MIALVKPERIILSDRQRRFVEVVKRVMKTGPLHSDEKKRRIAWHKEVERRRNVMTERIKKFLQKNTFAKIDEILALLELTPRVEMDAGIVYQILREEIADGNIERVGKGIYGRVGARGELSGKNKNTKYVRSKKASYYTPEELLAYAKANGLSERDIAESVESRRVGLRQPGFFDEG